MAVGDVEVAGVAGQAERRLAGAGSRRRRPPGHRRQLRLASVRSARTKLLRRILPHQRAALVGIGRAEQRGERHVGELGVAVERLAVGERELRALDDGVDALARRHRREVEAGQQRELLEHHRALPPRAGLADGVAVVVERDRRLERRLPARHVVAAQQPVLGREEAVDRLRDPAAVEGVAGGVDARLARVSPGARQPPVASRPAGRCGTAGPPRAPAGRRPPSSPTRPAAAPRCRGSPPRSPAPRDSRRARRRSPAPARRRAPRSRSRAASAPRRRTRRARRRRAGRSRGRARARARRRRRASRRRAPGPARRARAPCPPRRTRTPPGRRRPAR